MSLQIAVLVLALRRLNRPVRHQRGCQVTKEKRLGIYLRDGNRCLWCGRSGKEVALSLDHVVPQSHSLTPNNHASNLITACIQCNSRRKTKSLKAFAFEISSSSEIQQEILARIMRALRRSPHVWKARKILSSNKRESNGE